MPVIEAIQKNAQQMIDLFRDFHSHPELGFEEHRTSRIVAERLRAFGVDEVESGVGGTGVVGIIHGKGGHNRRIGLRADMDALPIQEVTGLGHASQNDGVMHACGHDGHTTMLLGAAQYLAEKRNFKGSVVLIFQPAEEGLGGARKMLAEGLFKRFPCDEIYGLHNKPDGNRGKFGLRKGPMMAGASFFDVIVRGKGGHAAMPDKSKDVIYIATSLVQHLQSVVSRSVAPDDPCVLSVTKISAGSAYNVLPDAAQLGGTLRYFSREVRDLAQSRVESICTGFAAAHEVCIDIQFRETADVLINCVAPADALLAAACEILGTGHVHDNERLTGGAEDFADMLREVPGAYGWLSHAGTMPLHSPAYVFDEEVLPLGASILAHVAERQLA
ncbi:amidohydrolase [Aestuariivirga sp.]|jgi:amidohydrolase|uniref:amidohydrolase n=1 Tax=Aestuariivirga sp. TaxID=2650926 RepID=UPI003784A6FB